jgi:hypothetical protein
MPKNNKPERKPAPSIDGHPVWQAILDVVSKWQGIEPADVVEVKYIGFVVLARQFASCLAAEYGVGSPAQVAEALGYRSTTSVRRWMDVENLAAEYPYWNTPATTVAGTLSAQVLELLDEREIVPSRYE